MSDFTSEFWNFYVIGIVVLSLLACLILLWSQGSVTYTAGKTTGHAWDEDLEEYNNPMPKWWSLLFYLTVVFSVVYLFFFPGLGKYQGYLNWSSAKYSLGADGTVANQAGSKYQSEVDTVNRKLEPTLNRYLALDIPTLAKDPKAMEMGQRLFQSYCIQCHGSDAKGSKGFPNLTNDDWQWGGEPEQIEATIAGGRTAAMTPHTDMSDETVKDIANYVLSLSGESSDSERIARGEAAFRNSDCLTCHDPGIMTGQPTGVPSGNILMGAPNLTDKVWLYSRNPEVVADTIKNGRNNQMPGWEGFLGKGKVHLLAAYVYSQSHK
ncbi:MAG: cytochrome-c oxidase, cbb3-type subunit III [Zoogloeaceae bacterium]|jgi:cytochrome c oxidase cbb3-type subunit 3|nr:cytochrome-c oxidase, cbb3-type subunit III [Zoogloeaceae bacterium]